jgi:5-methylcytosine-specific restriction endonuclease McrA
LAAETFTDRCMKRLNPKTNKPFKRGDSREDGFRFHHYRKNRPLKNGLYTEAWYNPEAFEKQNAGMAKWREENRQIAKEYTAWWQKENQAKVNSYAMQRHAAKIQRTPKWLTDAHKTQILGFYEEAKIMEKTLGGKYEVDHIVPLKGKTVSGLHVPWNLQILTKKENCSKNNNF